MRASFDPATHGARIPRAHDLLHRLLAEADLLETACGTFLLAPVTTDALEELIAYDGATEDLENTHDAEPDADGEPSLGAPSDWNQGLWSEGAPLGEVDREDDGDNREPSYL